MGAGDVCFEGFSKKYLLVCGLFYECDLNQTSHEINWLLMLDPLKSDLRSGKEMTLAFVGQSDESLWSR